jgi:hypothetical protein
MRATSFAPGNQLIARATTGQRLDIRYDVQTNSIVFSEDDWSADGLSGVSPRMAYREPLDSLKVRRLRRRAA